MIRNPLAEPYGEVLINNAAILTLNGSPVAVTGCPAVTGFLYHVTRGELYLTYGGTAYATNTTVNIVPTGSTGLTQCSFGTVLALTASAMRVCGPATQIQAQASTGLSVFVSAGNPTNGHANSTIRVRVYYKLLSNTLT